MRHRRTPSSPFLAGLVLIASTAAAPMTLAQEVVLRVHPRVGDTLHTQLEQQTEVSTVARQGSSAAKSMTTSVSMSTRTIVQSSLNTSTVVLTIVDSAAIRTTDVHSAARVAEAERMLRGQQLVLQLAADGAVESARDLRGTAVSREVADAMSSMPAIFPHRAVKVGEQWTRDMPLPTGGTLGARGMAHVDAVFRLDSLDRTGNLAYVSMRGDIKPEAGEQGVELSGAITGAMRLDRARGWLTDSRVSVLVRSLVTPPSSTGLAPMRFITRVTQRLRTMDKR